MTSITQFHDLPDLFFIQLFNYLSSVDILWTLTNLNNRIEALIHERGFFRHINFSTTCLSKFDRLLLRLPLNEIETLIINVEASPLQLSRWPYLPYLTTLRLYGLRDFLDATDFILRHSTSLMHLTLETNEFFMSLGFAGAFSYPRGRLSTLLENVLPHSNALHSLDCGQDTGFGLVNWYVTRVQCPLKYLRVPINDISQLVHLISRETLSTTLEQLHVTMRNDHVRRDNSLPTGLALPSMINLHTFTLVQSIFANSRIQWSTIEFLTTPNVMPGLRRMNLAIFISVNELDSINRSALFIDDRQIDIQFAFITDHTSLSNEVADTLPRGSRFYPREIVGVTCVVSHLLQNDRQMTNVNCYFGSHSSTYNVWYTLPWAFEQFFHSDCFNPVRYLIKAEVLTPLVSCSSIRKLSRLRTLRLAENNSLPSIVSMPHVVQLDRINKVHLFYHDWPSCFHLPALHHLTLINNLVALKDFSSFPSNIRSIQIILHPNMPNFVSNNWSILRSLSALPMLVSLDIVIHDRDAGFDHSICQIIAETIPMLVHFSVRFRNSTGLPRDDDQDDRLATLKTTFNDYQASIKELYRRILCSTSHLKPLIVLEERYYGLTVWL